MDTAPDRVSGGTLRATSRAITDDDFLGAVNETLESASIADERTLREVSRIVADAVNAYRDPNLSSFQLPGPARGVAVLLYETYRRGGHPFALALQVFRQWDVESLLADAWATIPAEEVARYGVPVAIWSDNPGDYRRIPLNALPPPHNLWKHGHNPDIYASYIALPSPERGRQFPSRRHTPAPTRTAQVVAARRDGFNRYVAAVKAGDVQLSDVAPWSAQEWADAVTFAHALTLQCRPWTKQAVDTAIRTRYALTPDARLVGEPQLVNILLNDPVRWRPGATELEGGQHRVFAAALAGQTDILARID